MGPLSEAGIIEGEEEGGGGGGEGGLIWPIGGVKCRIPPLLSSYPKTASFSGDCEEGSKFDLTAKSDVLATAHRIGGAAALAIF